MRPGRRQCRRQNPVDLRACLPAGEFSIAASQHSCSDSLGHRPVQNLQRGLGKLLDRGRRCQGLAAALGHVRGSPQGPEVRLRSVGRHPDVLRYRKDRVAGKLSGDVVPPDQEILPKHSDPARRMQKRRQIHLQG